MYLAICCISSGKTDAISREKDVLITTRIMTLLLLHREEDVAAELCYKNSFYDTKKECAHTQDVVVKNKSLLF